MDELITKNLEMIQNIINRMAQNSFLIKGWAITLVAALFALTVKDSKYEFIFLTYFPAVTFWILDGYYLYQEKLFRKLFNKVRKLNSSLIDFNMDTSEFKSEVTWLNTIFTKSLIIFYGVIIFSIAIVMFYLIIR